MIRVAAVEHLRNIAQEKQRVRKLLVASYCLHARLYRSYPEPRILLNSIPKSGTHLVRSVLGELPEIRFSGVHVTSTDFSSDILLKDEGALVTPNIAFLKRQLQNLPNGQYATSHFQYHSQTLEMIKSLNYRVVFIYRDPRDTVASMALFLLKQPRLYQRKFGAEHENIPTIITNLIGGFSRLTSRPGLVPLNVSLDTYLDWLHEPHALAVRFEDLIGPQGGGSEEVQIKTVRRISAHVNRELTETQLRAVARHVWSPASRTFRKGQVGGWREYFNEGHKDLFKTVAGKQLMALGYEDGDDW